jgi:superfamily II RNA helicase
MADNTRAMSGPLYNLLPPDDDFNSDDLLGRFLEYVTGKGLTLYPAQEEAILELFEDKNVILNTPTGSGKSLVASALHFDSLARRRRSVYTCPIKALVNEKWMALCRELGPENVGLATGDATVNRDAPVLCCTAEILANIALREGKDANVDDVVMDEFHWYADRDRGVAWQVPLLTLSHTRFLLMSATLGDVTFFSEALTALNGYPTATVKSTDRPVPLEYAYSEIPLAQMIEKLASEGKAPVYVVHFTQADAADSAQDFTSLNLATRHLTGWLAVPRADSQKAPKRLSNKPGLPLCHPGPASITHSDCTPAGPCARRPSSRRNPPLAPTRAARWVAVRHSPLERGTAIAYPSMSGGSI